MSGSIPPEYRNTMNNPAATLVGHRVGNFSVQRLIGEGAMGTVYLGLHETLNRHVAIKVLKPQLAANDLLVNRFIDEARAASSIGHPGLVQVLDFGTLPDGQRYSVMEFLNGRDLETALLQEGAQAIGRVAAIGAEVASALAAAHAKGIVHRDLKPANLFLHLDEEGAERVKVLDFGIAKLLAGSDSARTQAGHIVGTPEYMAPEQAQARTNIDHRVDIYALGCLLYELLVGVPPHTGDNIPSILVAQLQDIPVPPSHHRRDIPPVLEHIILRCLAKRPEDRFQSMEEVRAALLPLVDSSIAPPSSRRSRPLPPPTQPSMQGVRGMRTWLIALSALLAIGAAVAIFFVVKGASSDKKDNEAETVGAGNGDGDGDGSSAVATTTPDAGAATPSAPSSGPNPYKAADTAALAAGKTIYTNECARCHGNLGEGDGPDADAKQPPKAFSDATEDGTLDEYRFALIKDGAVKDGMPAFASKLEADDIWKVVTYVHSLSAVKSENVDEGLNTKQPKTTKALIRRGRVIYRRECRSCHGHDGKGRGRAAKYLARKPTDLTLGIYKLRSTPINSIPTDDDLFRTVTRGIGTGLMPGFPRVHPQDRWAVVAYLKTLSHRFAREKPRDVAVVPKRPPATAESIERGKNLFSMIGCTKCHGEAGDGVNAEIKELSDKRGNKLEAPDFTNKFDFLSQDDPDVIWQTMWNGLAGVKMPMGRTVFSEDDAWDVINWILSLSNR